MTTVQHTGAEGAKKSSEVLTPFKATPEALSPFLNLKADEVRAQMISEEKREKLVDVLLKNPKFLSTMHSFSPEDFRHQMKVAGEMLKANDEYLKDMKSPEKKSAFRRAFDKMRGFAWRHPFVTALLVACLAAGGYAAWHYAGNSVMAWLHGLAQTAPKEVLKRAIEAPPILPAPPGAPSGPWSISPLPPGLG